MKFAACLLLLSVAFTCVAAGSWAPGNDGDLFADLQINTNTLTAEAMTTYVPPQSPLGRFGASPIGCAVCKDLVSTHILSMVLNKVKQACADPKCPVIKARCEWIEANEEEFTGYVVYQIRPRKDAYFFCFGAGQCSHPAAQISEIAAPRLTDDDEVDFRSNSTTDFLAQLSRSADMVDRGLAPTNSTSVPEERSSWSVSVHTGDDDKKCYECLGKGVRWTMKRAIKSLIKKCEETKCPYFGAWCEWAKEHKKFVRGEIYAKVQPYKYAIGYCSGKGECKCDAVASFPFTMKGSKHSGDKHMLRD